MSYNLLKAFANEQIKQEIPKFSIGDTVRVHNRIKEGQRERIQIFEGTVIAKRSGGISETFTVRRISYGVGTEKTFPVHSPNISKVDVVRAGKVRRAKLYYLRERVGKRAKAFPPLTRGAFGAGAIFFFYFFLKFFLKGIKFFLNRTIYIVQRE